MVVASLLSMPEARPLGVDDAVATAAVAESQAALLPAASPTSQDSDNAHILRCAQIPMVVGILCSRHASVMSGHPGASNACMDDVHLKCFLAPLGSMG